MNEKKKKSYRKTEESKKDHSPTYPLEISLKEAFIEFLRGIPALIKLLYRLIRDERTPAHIKWWIGGSALYLIVPINLKFRKLKRFPVKLVNYVDDVVVIITVVQRVLKQTDNKLLEEHWDHNITIFEWQDMLYKIKTDVSNFV